MRWTLAFAVVFGASCALAQEANKLEECMRQCQQDHRAQADMEVIELNNQHVPVCVKACTVRDQTEKQIQQNTSKQWDPNHPVVQRCFAQSGTSDFNLAITNHATNNCIMDGLHAERAAAQKEVPIPTARPTDQANRSATPQAQPQTPPCDDRHLKQLEDACVREKNAALSACADSHLEALPPEPSTAGASIQEACARNQAYQTQAGGVLDRYIRQCSQGKNSCQSSCGALRSAVEQLRGGSCSAQVISTYQSSAGALGDLCTGLGSRLPQVQAELESLAHGSVQSSQCVEQTADSSAAPESQKAASTRGQSANQGASGDQGGRSGGTSGGPVGRANTSVQGGSLGTGAQYDTSASLRPQTGTTGNFSGQNGGASETTNYIGEDQSRWNAPGGSQEPGSSMNVSGSLGNTGGYISPSQDLAALPTRKVAIENEEKESVSGSGATGRAGSGSASAAGGRRLAFGMRPLGAKALSDSSSAVKGASAQASETPDFNAFRPRMGGMNGTTFEGHGPHANIFQKMTERYRALDRTFYWDP